jgi:type VI secretion system protein ImpA
LFDVEALLAPVSDEKPVGPDLEYDPDFIALETAARGKPEQQYGATVIPAEEPDWDDVYNRAEALLGRTKDLRVAVLLARAATRRHNSEGLAAGLRLVHEMLTRYWDSVHPDLDHDDHGDPTMRLNALAPLADNDTFLRDVRHAYVVSTPQHGRVSFRDVLVATGRLPGGGDGVPGQAEIDGIVRAAASSDPASVQAALDALESIEALQAFLSDKGILTQAPELTALDGMLKAVAPVCRNALGVSSDAAGGLATAEQASTARQSAGGMQSNGQIASRDDAIRALESVCRFIEQAEPSNPAPLFIRRAQRLMSRSFMEIIQDLAPESLAQIEKLAGVESKSAE